ncbi:MAG: SusC/RagA family TonB-linked outer membrane protein [Prolixibacteraceae bacterium]|jgi:TonB-linked SusC/RagA family outer membrane protein|nr:SusC/RagA family TonB-linked outer membrane protein [Prolixibacteraceae bacterium]
MKKKREILFPFGDEMRLRIRKMKLTLLMVFLVMATFGNSFSQVTLSLHFNKANIQEVLGSIEKKTDYIFLYKDYILNGSQEITVDFQDAKFEEVLKFICEQSNVDYEVHDRQIILKEKANVMEPLVQQQPKRKEITGTVKDNKGLPLPGVSVVVKGTTTGIVTDKDGKFTLSVPLDAKILVFSFVGMKKEEITLTANPTVNLVMLEENVGMDDVVVIGYGIQKLTKVSGAISTVKAADIMKLNPVRIEEALQGGASGVTIIGNGSPGSKPLALIRGIPSFTGTDPVVIVDGIPQTLTDLNAINPADIESVSVLKDAATTAIYGVKGGNGVIVITTKSGGKNQKTQFGLNTNIGQQGVVKEIDMLNATEYATINNEGSLVSGGQKIFNDPAALGVGTNWQDQIFHKASVSSYNLTAKGGGDKMSYFISGGYLGQGGIVAGSDKSKFERYNATANLIFDLTPKLRLILNTSYAHTQRKTVPEGSFGAVIGNALNFDPTVPVYNTVPNTIGTYRFSNLITKQNVNPLAQIDATHNVYNEDKLYGKAELQYDVLKNLKITSRLGYVKWESLGKIFNQLAFYGPAHEFSSLNADATIKGTNHNSVNEDVNASFNYTFETFANYSYIFKEKHTFNAVAGISAAQLTGHRYYMTRQDIRDNSWDWADMIAATGVNSASNTNAIQVNKYKTLTRRNASYFGRIEYDYEAKYLASFSARRDGSMAFGKNNRFANFYAGSLGWVVTKEDFFKSDVINYLKIRGSYGTSGNEKVDPVLATVSIGGPNYEGGGTPNNNGYQFDGLLASGATISSFANPFLRWEKQSQLDIGFDVTLLKNFSLTADYFDKKVDGLLFVSPIPFYAGTLPAISSNVGSTKSSGVDLTVSYHNSGAKDLKFNTSVTVTSAKNLVTSTNINGSAFLSGGGLVTPNYYLVTRYQKGYPPGYFYGWKTDGLFQNAAQIAASPTQNAVPGDIKYVDVSGPKGIPDGKIDAYDRTQIGNPYPKFTLGWNLGFEYKDFDLSVFTYASIGNDIYMGGYTRGFVYDNMPVSVLNRWTGEGSTNDARNPRYTFKDNNENTRPSDRFIVNGTFAKIKNLEVGYTLPSPLLKKIGISQLRLYLQAKNLHTFTKYPGFDPEISDGSNILNTGVDLGLYPQSRTYSVGLNVKF